MSNKLAAAAAVLGVTIATAWPVPGIDALASDGAGQAVSATSFAASRLPVVAGDTVRLECDYEGRKSGDHFADVYRIRRSDGRLAGGGGGSYMPMGKGDEGRVDVHADGDPVAEHRFAPEESVNGRGSLIHRWEIRADGAMQLGAAMFGPTGTCELFHNDVPAPVTDTEPEHAFFAEARHFDGTGIAASSDDLVSATSLVHGAHVAGARSVTRDISGHLLLSFSPFGRGAGVLTADRTDGEPIVEANSLGFDGPTDGSWRFTMSGATAETGAVLQGWVLPG